MEHTQPEQTTLPSTAEAIASDTQKSRANYSTLFMSSFALLISLITALALIFYYYNVTSTTADLISEISALRLQIEQNQTSIQQMINTETQLQVRLQQQETALTNLQQLKDGDLAAWRLAEAKYLVQLAYYHLTFTRDVSAALALLQIAEQRIGTLNDPTLITARQLLANNILALQAVPKIDLAGLLTRITALQIQVTQLPTLGLPTTKPSDVSQDGSSLSPLRKAMHDSWVTLQKIIIIRQSDKPIEPLLSPEQQVYLHQNLQLILQQAQWAALRGQNDVYQSSLQQAKKWIERYFALNLPVTQAFGQALTDLQKINVQPTLPDLSSLARTVQQLTLRTNKQNKGN